MVIPMELPTQADLMWFAILMLGIIILTQLQDRYRKKQEREWEGDYASHAGCHCTRATNACLYSSM